MACWYGQRGKGGVQDVVARDKRVWLGNNDRVRVNDSFIRGRKVTGRVDRFCNEERYEFRGAYDESG
jgi:hypothetical protein